MDTINLINNEFSRSIGIFSEVDLEKLLNARVAVAGAGGVGGIHLLTLARMGVGKFNIADLDEFERVNISRQFGALQSTVGQHKADVLASMIKDINPAADVETFREGVSEDNVDDFLKGASIFVDGIEFFEVKARRLVFRKAREQGMYSLTAAPLGFGSTLQVFSPDGMSFDQYCGIDDSMSDLEQLAGFAAGLTPHPFHIRYMDMSKVNFETRKGPAVSPACTLAASLVASEAAKIITGKGTVRAVPHYLQFDMRLRKFRKGYSWGGGKNPFHKYRQKKLHEIFLNALNHKV